jgi:hypothetical protein
VRSGGRDAPGANYNVAPTTHQPIIRQSRESGEREMVLARWGLVPFFTKELSDIKGLSTINARAESITKAPTWRGLIVEERPSRLALAIAEVGRIDKTIHTLNFIDDESRQRSTLQQLNLTEGRHSLARNVFHGKRGELHQRYREGQEDQLSALGLVVNMIVLWNTIYMNAILDQLRMEGYDVNPEDEARLSPFGHDHVNMLGRYSFAIPDAVVRGELRPPLRTANES